LLHNAPSRQGIHSFRPFIIETLRRPGDELKVSPCQTTSREWLSDIFQLRERRRKQEIHFANAFHENIEFAFEKIYSSSNNVITTRFTFGNLVALTFDIRTNARKDK